MMCLHGFQPGTAPMFVNSTKEVVEIESLDSFVTVRETVLEEDLRPPTVLTFEQYRAMTQERWLQRSWREYVLTRVVASEAAGSTAGGINLDIPFKIKSKAFQKVFGSGSVGLVVTGDISITAKLRRENRSEVLNAVTRGADTNFNMQQKQRFSVTGKIGDKVTVNVDQDSERAFDFENNVRIKYQGYDDEIIQRIEAGNISLALPGTRYVTFSGKNAGLFGLKSEMLLGNLNVTTIASQEKGESQRITLTGGAEEGSHQIRIDNYVKDTYFFLDPSYREDFKQYDAEGNHLASSNSIIEIEVYKAANNNLEKFPDQVIPAWATFAGLPDSVTAEDTTEVRNGESEFGYFLRLEKGEYFVENNLGFIRLNSPLASEEILAVTYRTGGLSGQTFGGTVAGTNTRVLKLIRSKKPHPSQRTWNLAWKHVYFLGKRNLELEGFELKIFFKPSAGSPEETDDTGEKWVTVFGLDNKDLAGVSQPDGVIDIDNNILDRFNGELHFRDLQPFAPLGYFISGVQNKPILDSDEIAERIYNSTDSREINQDADNFVIEVKSKSRSAEYNLGFNVIEGSEVVKLDGQEMVNGTHYTIDYFTGSLTILDERAGDPNRQLEISFERNQLFQLEKKTILGMRAEYDLGRNSFLGGTLLYLNESTLDRKVRVGRGPIRNLVWDVNTQLNFNPNFIGRAFDALPFIRAQGETILNFEGEIAQVLPTPNTLNSPGTGDHHGVAYIDDFEGSKKTVSLGVLRRNWTRASVPDERPQNTIDNMVNYFWFNPVEQRSIQDIYPNRDINPNIPDRTHVLTFQLFPDPTRPDPRTWGGLMRALSPGLHDQTQTKFIEIMVQGERGRLHIDLGSISEDILPNGVLDLEDLGLRDGSLDRDKVEDTGIDRVVKDDPPQLNFPRKITVDSLNVDFDFWDINRDGVKNFNEPWSYDNWVYPELSNIYITEGQGSINGTETNANDEGGLRSDTEDINGNGILDRVNSYYSYTFSLTPNHPDTALIVGGNPNNPPARGGPWKLYRIPFDTVTDSLQVGQPSPIQIENVRIWLELDDVDVSTPVTITIADISLVGSDWKELGSTRNEFNLATGFEDSTVAVTDINTHEDPFYASKLREIGVEGEEDRVTGVQAREQSLVLKATNLADTTGANVGVAQKSFFQSESYLNYDRIKMFVYGRPANNDSVHVPNVTTQKSFLEYFIRFGSDINNYYEYRSTIYEGWNPAKNTLDVRLQEFTELQTDFSKILAPDGSKSIRKKGNPSLTNIKTLILGIKNLHPTQEFTGDVWFNELRLSDVDRDKGMAVRFRTNLQIGDFASVSGEIERKQADFHNVAERFGNGDNSTSGSFNASVGLDKMLPQSWGIAMPLSFNYRASSSTPKYFPGKDRLVPADSLKSPRILTERDQRGFSLLFRKQALSNNFFVKNTLDKVSFTFGQTKTHFANPTTVFSDNQSWTGNFDYRIEFGRNNFFSPFSWFPNLPVIGKIKGTKFYYTPQNISFRVDGAKIVQSSQNRLQNINLPDSAQARVINTETFTIDRSARANMKIFESLVVDISRVHKADMRGRQLVDFFTGGAQDINVSQTFTVRYNPNVFSWLNNTFNYSSNYGFTDNIQQRLTGRGARNSVTRSADFTLRWQQLAQAIFGTGKKKPSGRPTPGATERRPPPGEGEGKEEEPPKDLDLNWFQEKKDGGGLSFNPLKLFGSFISKFRDISFNYTERKSVSHLGLAAGQPSLAFQFGLSDTTSLATVNEIATQPITLSDNTSYRASSGLALGRAFDVGLSFQHSAQRNISTQIQTSGSYSDNWLKFNKFDMPFPEVTVRVAGLEKLPLFSKIFKTVTLSHGFSGQRDITWNRAEDNITQTNFTTNFRPLGQVDLNFIKGFTGKISTNRSTTLNINEITGGANRTIRSDVSVSANYSKQSGFRIPIWPFNKGELKNTIDFAFTFTASGVLTERRLGIGGKFEEQERTQSWSFSPRLTYSFSNRVRGGAFFEVGQTDSKRTGKNSIQEFGIDINISIRGN